jgi:cytosine/adenosine deaminase-related metal-dependent hydrolase
MTSTNLLLQNILYLEGKRAELKRGNLAIVNGCIDLESSHGIEIDASGYIAVPGFLNVASENLVFRSLCRISKH